MILYHRNVDAEIDSIFKTEIANLPKAFSERKGQLQGFYLRWKYVQLMEIDADLYYPGHNTCRSLVVFSKRFRNFFDEVSIDFILLSTVLLYEAPRKAGLLHEEPREAGLLRTEFPLRKGLLYKGPREEGLLYDRSQLNQRTMGLRFDSYFRYSDPSTTSPSSNGTSAAPRTRSTAARPSSTG